MIKPHRGEPHFFRGRRFMTVLEALATLESAVLECKKRNVNTPEVKNALDLL